MSGGGEPLPVAVVGVGHLGRHHARLHAASPRARLVAVVDRDIERARAIAAEHGCEAHASIEPLFGRIAAASVATPTKSHREVAVRLIEAGIDVLVEKPLARTLEEVDAIIGAADRHGRLVMAGHSERFNPAVRALERAIDRPRFFEVHRLAAFTARSTDVDVVLDLMIHDLDLLLHLDGSAPTSVDASGVAALTDKIDIANARIRLASGCVANVTASRISAEPVRRIRVFQAATYLACDTGARTVERYRVVRAANGEPRIEHDRLEVEQGEPLGLEIEEFLDAVRSRRSPDVDARQARQAIELAWRVRQAIESSTPP